MSVHCIREWTRERAPDTAAVDCRETRASLGSISVDRPRASVRRLRGASQRIGTQTSCPFCTLDCLSDVSMHDPQMDSQLLSRAIFKGYREYSSNLLERGLASLMRPRSRVFSTFRGALARARARTLHLGSHLERRPRPSELTSRLARALVRRAVPPP